MSALYDATSRYVLDEGNRTASRKAIAVERYVLYTARQGDTLEALAHRHLGNFRRFWEIADMNPQIKFPLDITVGTVIRLPT